MSNNITIQGDVNNIYLIKETIGKIINQNDKVIFETLIGSTTENDWGTKDVSYEDSEFLFTENKIYLSPETEWDPPIGFCLILSEKYNVTVDIIYYEIGNDFCGRIVIQGGEIVSKEEYEFMKGLYYLYRGHFWTEFEFDIVSKGITENQIRERYGYCDEEDLNKMFSICREKSF